MMRLKQIGLTGVSNEALHLTWRGACIGTKIRIVKTHAIGAGIGGMNLDGIVVTVIPNVFSIGVGMKESRQRTIK